MCRLLDLVLVDHKTVLLTLWAALPTVVNHLTFLYYYLRIFGFSFLFNRPTTVWREKAGSCSCFI